MQHWHERFLGLAQMVSTFSRDPSTRVGAVIVRPDKTIASLGFNGFARGVADHPERYQDRTLKYELIIHAEINAILAAHTPLHGCTLYTYPFMPCARCAGAIIQAGITTVIAPFITHARWQESFERTQQMFDEAGVALQLLDVEPWKIEPANACAPD